jgi:phosphoribosyl-dephospho-CoA transferase
MPDLPFQRHDLVWLSPRSARAARPACVCTAKDSAAIELLADWLAGGHPLIVTRQPSDCPAGLIQLGLALPPMLGKRRHAFLMDRTAVTRHAPPPLLAEAAERLPDTLRTSVERLLALPAVRATEPRLFGSAAMEVITGLRCLGPQSDLDLLLSPRSFAEAVAAVEVLSTLQDGRDAPRVDGELRNRRGDDVAWRELALAPPRLLVKRFDSVALIDYPDFADGFASRIMA